MQCGWLMVLARLGDTLAREQKGAALDFT